MGSRFAGRGVQNFGRDCLQLQFGFSIAVCCILAFDTYLVVCMVVCMALQLFRVVFSDCFKTFRCVQDNFGWGFETCFCRKSLRRSCQKSWLKRPRSRQSCYSCNESIDISIYWEQGCPGSLGSQHNNVSHVQPQAKIILLIFVFKKFSLKIFIQSYI